METREEIQRLEERQLELLSEMRRSDDHAAKCSKLGRPFGQDYPEEYAAYVAANAEYNANEKRLAGLRARLADEEAECLRPDETFNETSE